MRYIISYDLVTPGKNYQALYDAVAALGASRVLLSEWITRRYNTSATGLRDHLRQFVDASDRLLVVCLDSTDWAGRNLMTDPNRLAAQPNRRARSIHATDPAPTRAMTTSSISSSGSPASPTTECA